jgi:hypothetical protein
MRRLWIALALVLTVTWVACGGGSSNSNVVTGPTTTLGSPGPAPSVTTTVGADYFALDMGPATPWPTQLSVNFGIWRSLGAEVRWSQLEPCQPTDETNPNDPCYTWSVLDPYLQSAKSNGQQVLFTTFYTPQWISSNSSSTCQQSTANNITAGGCFLPSDVLSGDTTFKNFLTALFNHVQATSGDQTIKYWECWNEPNVPDELDPSQPLSSLHQLCSDLRSTISALDSSAQFTTPAPALGTLPNGVVGWLTGSASSTDGWVTQNFDDVADIIAFHGYTCGASSPCTLSDAELISQILSPLETNLKTISASSKPIWDTEAGDNTAGAPLPDPDEHAAYMLRISLIQQSMGVATFSYWGWNFGGVNLESNGTLNDAGIAWQQLYKWTNGATYTNVCTNSNGTLWQCGFKLNGTPYLVLWDTAQSCSGGTCSTSNVAVPSQYSEVEDVLTGASSTITSSTVQASALPILIH